MPAQQHVSFYGTPALMDSDSLWNAACSHSAHNYSRLAALWLTCMKATYCSRRPDSRRLSSWRCRPRLRSLVTWIGTAQHVSTLPWS